MATDRDLIQDLTDLGLLSIGRFAIKPEDGDLPAPATAEARSGVLVGNAGSAMWNVFKVSDEARDGRPDPLDRWTRRVLSEIASSHGHGVVFPFGGPPWWPFIRWAQRIGVYSQSPLGVLVHPDFGPWSAFRAVLITAEPLDNSRRDTAPSAPGAQAVGPCPGCVDKPCLSACPVHAISIDAPCRVDVCRTHVGASLSSDLGPTSCHAGCRARAACPVGTNYRHEPPHGQFHMTAFAPKT